VRRSSYLFITLALILSGGPVLAHYPVNLKASHNTLSKSPILLDGTISFAVYADFSKAKDQRSVRFALREGDDLNVEYLIVDAAPTNKLKSAQLPSIAITTPSGKKIAMKINERSPFYEPYGKKNYFFLSRISQSAEAGIYSITATAKTKSSAVIAIGRTEIRGKYLEVGSSAGKCPITLKSEEMISEARAKQLISMSELEAEVCAAANSWIYRIGERDGEGFILTKDYRTNRVTVSIESGFITKVSVG
jgi:hypothetical protein